MIPDRFRMDFRNDLILIRDEFPDRFMDKGK